MRRTGFTLIELLVVIAIIAILAAILFPVFARARQKAMATTCLSNFKELTLSALMYCSDYDGKTPPPYYYFGTCCPQMGCCGPTDQKNGPGGCLEPYVKNALIWGCPSDPNPGGSATYVNGPTSYGMNYNLFGYNFSTGVATLGNGCVSIDHYSYPAQRMFISESNGGGGESGGFYWLTSAAGVPAWHNLGANQSYCDGHAAWILQAAIRPEPGSTFTDPVACAYWTGMDLPGGQ